MPICEDVDVVSVVNFHFRIGLGALLSGAHLITDGMLQAASEWYAAEHYNLYANALIFNSPKLSELPLAEKIGVWFF